MRTLIPLIAVGLTLGGCDMFNAPAGGGGEQKGGSDAPAASSSGAFTYSASEDISGYYRPSGMSGADDFELTQVFVGQARDFQAWNRGERSATFAPVMLEFAVLGGQTLRILPERYSVGDDRVSMQGTAPGVGKVSFDARLDKGALATARRNLGGSEDAAMIGTVRVGGQSFTGVKFSWYGGD